MWTEQNIKNVKVALNAIINDVTIPQKIRDMVAKLLDCVTHD